MISVYLAGIITGLSLASIGYQIYTWDKRK